MGVRRLFSQRKAKFSRGAKTYYLSKKNTKRDTIFLKKGEKHTILVGQGGGRPGGGDQGPP